MKLLGKIIFILPLLVFSMQLAGSVNTVHVTGQLYVNIPTEAGHQMPVVEFLRRFERIFRQFAHLSATNDSKKILFELSPAQLPGVVEVQKRSNEWIVILPMELDTLLDSPDGGRVMASALLQSRLGNPIQTALPAEALWVADGIWAEFVSRERSGDMILYFTWLPGLRNMVTNGYPLNININTLMPPEPIRKNSAPWQLYSERARLLVELSSHMVSSDRSNLLKDYCFLLFGKRLTPQECFIQTFGKAAVGKLAGSGIIYPQDTTGEDSAAMALEVLALRTLFTAYAPMPPQALKKRFMSISTLQYQDPQGRILTAELSDLPALVEKIDSCAAIPRVKIMELNILAMIAPLQLRNNISSLTRAVSDIGFRPAAEVTNEIKKHLDAVNSKLNFFIKVDQELAMQENELLPPLYYQRHLLDEEFPAAPLPGNIQSFIDRSAEY